MPESDHHRPRRNIRFSSKWSPVIRAADAEGVSLRAYMRAHGYTESEYVTCATTRSHLRRTARLGITCRSYRKLSPRWSHPKPEQSEKPQSSLDGWT